MGQELSGGGQRGRRGDIYITVNNKNKLGGDVERWREIAEGVRGGCVHEQS